MNFNFKTYQTLLASLQSWGFSFLTVSEYAEAMSIASCSGNKRS
jgi:hypothetical protein